MTSSAISFHIQLTTHLVEADTIPTVNTDVLDNLGIIEVVVLRCQEDPKTRPLDPWAFPVLPPIQKPNTKMSNEDTTSKNQRKSKKNAKALSENGQGYDNGDAFGGMFGMGIFDGAADDKPAIFGVDGHYDARDDRYWHPSRYREDSQKYDRARREYREESCETASNMEEEVPAEIHGSRYASPQLPTRYAHRELSPRTEQYYQRNGHGPRPSSQAEMVSRSRRHCRLLSDEFVPVESEVTADKHQRKQARHSREYLDHRDRRLREEHDHADTIHARRSRNETRQSRSGAESELLVGAIRRTDGGSTQRTNSSSSNSDADSIETVNNSRGYATAGPVYTPYSTQPSWHAHNGVPQQAGAGQHMHHPSSYVAPSYLQHQHQPVNGNRNLPMQPALPAAPSTYYPHNQHQSNLSMQPGAPLVPSDYYPHMQHNYGIPSTGLHRSQPIVVASGAPPSLPAPEWDTSWQQTTGHSGQVLPHDSSFGWQGRPGGDTERVRRDLQRMEVTGTGAAPEYGNFPNPRLWESDSSRPPNTGFYRTTLDHWGNPEVRMPGAWPGPRGDYQYGERISSQQQSGGEVASSDWGMDEESIVSSLKVNSNAQIMEANDRSFQASQNNSSSSTHQHDPWASTRTNNASSWSAKLVYLRGDDGTSNQQGNTLHGAGKNSNINQDSWKTSGNYNNNDQIRMEEEKKEPEENKSSASWQNPDLIMDDKDDQNDASDNDQQNGVANDENWDQSGNDNNNDSWDKPTTDDSVKKDDPKKQENKSEAKAEAGAEKPYTRSYWTNQGSVEEDQPGAKTGTKRSKYTIPEDPIYTISERKAKEEHLKHQVRGGKGAEKQKKTYAPLYWDTLEQPFAVFRFRYRSRGKPSNSLYACICCSRRHEAAIRQCQ